ncbi:CBS domain-containing protein [Pseudoxanthomonas koreensis]|uniref:CBS domain-containing protein n=1 Tax=Pseudoxanthomonas koreensis TaxID=266061 RepID=UPI0035A683BB
MSFHVDAGRSQDRVGDLLAYQASLSLRLIATSRENFVTCGPDEPVAAVQARVSEDGFDHVPVEHEGAIIGVLDVRDAGLAAQGMKVRDIASPVAERHLVGADTSILEFLEQAHVQPFRFLVSRGRIDALVSISDIQQLPVRACLFALVTQLEMVMAEVISARFADPKDWLSLLKADRCSKVVEVMVRAKRDNSQVDPLLYTQFCDKREIVEKLMGDREAGVSRSRFKRTFEEIEKLRNNLAHANELSATASTCKLVTEMRRWIAELDQLARACARKDSSAAERERMIG